MNISLSQKFKGFVLENIILPMGDLVSGGSYMRELKKWRKIEKLSTEEIMNLQQEKLLKLIKFACNHVDFYKELNIVFDTNDPYVLINRFSIINKQYVNQNIEKFLSVKHKEKFTALYSSGSSGNPGVVYIDKKTHSRIRALNTLFWEWGDYKIGYPTLQLGATLKRSFEKRVKDMLFNVDYQEAFNLDDQIILEVLKKYINKKAFFIGYASGLYTYAKVAKKYNVNVQFYSVISLGDKMFDHYRELIEEQFKCKVFVTYGSNEGFSIASEAADGKMYQISPHVYIEILNKDLKPVKPGEVGKAYVTSLDNYVMPLIRFDIGDLVALSEEPASEQNLKPFPLVAKVIGRDTDIIYTRSGKSLIVHFFTVIMGRRNDIEQFRVVQINMDKIVIEYIPTLFFGASTLAEINSRVREYVSEEELEVEFKEVEKIPNSPSGKPQIIVSQLPKQEIIS